MSKKIAVVLFNLGGPDNLAAVRPFLFNLFKDPAIIRLPSGLRHLVAWLISSRRDKVAQKIYAQMGGGSPILPNTQAQADALETALNNSGGDSYKCFIAMRYWKPFTDDIVRAVNDYAPEQILLMPLYPQFSTTTSASSADLWRFEAAKLGVNAPTKMLCCYPDDAGFIATLARSLKPAYAAATVFGKPRVLFSAHGLPEKIVAQGDPYQWQCERTAEALAKTSGIADLDWVLCYQSRVGPMQWIKPATDVEIRRAGAEKVPVVVVPIAFVSEHSETLVEIDIEYRHLAGECGVPYYGYVPTVGVAPEFINGLAVLVQQSLADGAVCRSNRGGRLCPKKFSGCPMPAAS